MTIFLMILASWRIANLLADTTQSGPFELLDWFRAMMGVKYSDGSIAYGSSSLASMILCIKCNSVWIGIVFALLYYLTPEVTFFVSLPFALSGMMMLIESLYEVLDGHDT
jgi:hypothetical protein